MLEPLDRRHLLESLRPPAGYDLNVALGTTFSLDLMTLLTVPLAFALSDWEDEEGRPTANPLALLEAIRRYADKTHIFCQAGGIYLPKGNTLFLSHLENAVHEVVAPRKGGIFHPKVWVLRFTPQYEDKPVLYRVLVLSRNLTFDSSWDTLLLLEGDLRDRTRSIRQSAPIGAFVEALPGMMLRRPTQELRRMVKMVAEELRRVRFDLPEGFEDLTFHPMGIPGTDDWWFGGRIQRMLTISPFLDPSILPDLGSQEDGDVLVSRLDQLRHLPPESLRCFKEIYFLAPDADPEVEAADGDDPEDGSATLSGLHAKLYVADDGWKGRIWTGSANATGAAMKRNVEFLVELKGKKSFCGVDAVLERAKTKGDARFADMLSRYTPDNAQEPPDPSTAELERLSLRIRSALAASRIQGTVAAAADPERFDVSLALVKHVTVSGVADLRVRIWPVTVHEEISQEWPLPSGGKAVFHGASFEALTTFYGVEVRGRVGEKKLKDRFVLNIPMKGMPSDRRKRVLSALLKNRNRVLQFLLFLLAEDGDIGMLTSVHSLNDSSAETAFTLLSGTSLFESLVTALHRDPDKLDSVDRVIEDLNGTDEGRQLLPEGLMEIWQPVWAARQEIWQ